MSYKPNKNDIPFIENRIGVAKNHIQKIKDIIQEKKKDIKNLESEIIADEKLLNDFNHPTI